MTSVQRTFVRGERVDFLIERAGDEVLSIAWRPVLDEDDDRDWDAIIADVTEAASSLDAAEAAAWSDACGRGRGPDADAAIDGWRYVV